MLLNGPPGVGKSTVSAGLIERRALALNVDIDELRMRLGGWRDHPEAKAVARSLGFGLAKNHLDAGHDVVMPQLLCRFEVIDQLSFLATSSGAAFVEVVLVAPVEEILRRLTAGDDSPHPRDHLSTDELRSHIEFADRELRRRADLAPDAVLVDVGYMREPDALSKVVSAIGW